MLKKLLLIILLSLIVFDLTESKRVKEKNYTKEKDDSYFADELHGVDSEVDTPWSSDVNEDKFLKEKQNIFVKNEIKTKNNVIKRRKNKKVGSTKFFGMLKQDSKTNVTELKTTLNNIGNLSTEANNETRNNKLLHKMAHIKPEEENITNVDSTSVHDKFSNRFDTYEDDEESDDYLLLPKVTSNIDVNLNKKILFDGERYNESDDNHFLKKENSLLTDSGFDDAESWLNYNDTLDGNVSSYNQTDSIIKKNNVTKTNITEFEGNISFGKNKTESTPLNHNFTITSDTNDTDLDWIDDFGFFNDKSMDNFTILNITETENDHLVDKDHKINDTEIIDNIVFNLSNKTNNNTSGVHSDNLDKLFNETNVRNDVVHKKDNEIHHYSDRNITDNNLDTNKLAIIIILPCSFMIIFALIMGIMIRKRKNKFNKNNRSKRRNSYTHIRSEDLDYSN